LDFKKKGPHHQWGLKPSGRISWAIKFLTNNEDSTIKNGDLWSRKWDINGTWDVHGME
jgi:hypothetical protein